jgi:lysophospholipase L1-like esterase
MEKQKIKILSFTLLACLGIVTGYSIGMIYDYNSPHSIKDSMGFIKGIFHKTSIPSEQANKDKDYHIENLIDYNVEGPIYNLMKRNVSGKGSTIGGIVYHVDTNSKGLRDEAFNKTPSDDTYRILIIGDSYTFGWGVSESNRYTEILEKRLNQNHRKNYQIINAGIPGWGIKDYYTFLKRRGLSYQPDMIVIGLVGNDFIPHSDHTKIQREAKREIEEKYNRSKTSRTKYHRLVVDRMIKKLQRYRAKRSRNESDTYIYSRKIYQIGEEENTDTIFYEVGQLWPKSNMILESADIDFVRTPIPEENQRKYRFKEDSHLNAKAQPLLADKLYQHLRENYLIPN